MSTREYIGARYVPKYANPIEWDNRRTYENFMIVTHEGNSYTSLKPVPSGVLITNTDYWVKTSNFNAQVDFLYGKYSDLEHGVDSANVKSDIVIQNSFIPRAVSTQPFNKRLLIIGDSYNDQGRGQYSTYGVTVWGEHLRELIGFTPDECTNIGVSGSGWTTDGTSYTDTSFDGVNFGNIIERVYTDETPYPKVIIGGGLNDVIKSSSDISRVGAEIKASVEYIHEINPNCVVYIALVGHTMKQNQYRAKEFVDTVGNITDCNFVFLNGVQYAMIGKDYLLDDITHPTNEGERRIAEAIYQKINGGELNYDYKFGTFSVKNNKQTLPGGGTNSYYGKTVTNFDLRIRNGNVKTTYYDIQNNLDGYVFDTSESGDVVNIEIGVIDNLPITFSENITIIDRNVGSGMFRMYANNINYGSANYTVEKGMVDFNYRWWIKTTWVNSDTPVSTLNLQISGRYYDETPERNNYYVVNSCELTHFCRSALTIGNCVTELV